MNWKKIFSAVLAAAMVTLCGSVFAEPKLSEETIFDLRSLGILKGDENGELHLEDGVTRAEFTEMARRLVQMENWNTIRERTEFSDVKQDDWYYDTVYCMYDLGVIQGDGDGNFRPEAPVSTLEAAKMLIMVLGYEQEAEDAGGYPKGYQTAAMTMGIVRDVEFQDAINRTEALLMINRCLDLYLPQSSYDGSNGLQSERETLRDRLMGVHSAEKLFFVRGVVEATASAWILPGTYEDLEDNQLVIDGVMYESLVPEAADYIGKQVECYVRMKDQKRVIQSIRETDKNTVLKIRDNDLVTVDSGIISYQALEKVKNARLSDTAVLLRNMRLEERWTDNDIRLNQGEVTLIDNDGDKLYDVIHVQEFETYRISEVKENVVYFDVKGTEKKNFINFDTDDTDYILQNAKGEKLEPSDLHEDQVVSVFESRNGSVCRLVTGEKAFDAELTAVSENEFRFGEHVYMAETKFSDEYRVGDTYRVYLNYRNDLFSLKEDADIESVQQYGYVAEVASDNGLSPRLIAKVVNPGDFVEVEEKSEVEDDDNVTLILKGQNKGLEEMHFASRVSVNGQKMETKELLKFFGADLGIRQNRVIAYRINSNGEIVRIDTPKSQGREFTEREEKRIYNAKEKIFGGMLVGAFGATEQTKVLMIPDYEKQGSVDDQDYYAVAEINDQQSYTVNGYDVYGDRECVRLITIMTTLQYDASSTILDTDKMALLTEVSESLNEEGEQVTRLSFLSDGSAKAYTVDEDRESLAKSMTPGDIFYYAVSPSSNEINKIVRVDNAINPERGMVQFGQPGDSNPEGIGQITAGVVTNITFEKISDLSNRRKDQVDIRLGDGSVVSVYVNSRNAPGIYRYDTRKNTAETITSRDILPNDGHIMVHIKNDTVRGLVVVH